MNSGNGFPPFLFSRFNLRFLGVLAVQLSTAGSARKSNQPVTIGLQNPEPLPYFTLSFAICMMLHSFLSAPADVLPALFP
jgi:uncharacterized membrane protein YadS